MKVLQKYPNNKEFNPTDQFKVNPSFKNNLYRIKVQVAQTKSSKIQETADLTSKVEDDRKHLIEAVLVKIMKTRKRLHNNSLVAEATKILYTKFQPDPQIIKTRIESLIERDYMERDQEDRKFLKYLA